MSVASGRVTHLPLRPEATSPDAVFTDMVDSWRRQQLSRNFRHETISGRERTIRRFADFTGHFPWEWKVRGRRGLLRLHALGIKPVPGHRPGVSNQPQTVLRLPHRSGL